MYPYGSAHVCNALYSLAARFVNWRRGVWSGVEWIGWSEAEWSVNASPQRLAGFGAAPGNNHFGGHYAGPMGYARFVAQLPRKRAP